VTDAYWVSHAGVVHDAASNCGGSRAERYPWTSRFRLDRACRNCLPDGLPVNAAEAAWTIPSDPFAGGDPS
jgi:hypothetical protein